MRGRALTVALTALAVATPGAAAAISETPRDGWVPDRPVSDVVELPSGDLLVSGTFRRWAPRTGSLVAVDAAAGALRAGVLPEVAGGDVSALVADGRGGWYAGGSFRYVGGRPRSGLVHLTASGQVDRAFRADVLTREGPTDLPGSVRVLAVAGDRVYVGGGFTHVGGKRRDGLAAVDARTGRVLDWAPPIVASARALLVAGGTVLVGGGEFYDASGVQRAGLLAMDALSGAILPFDARIDGEVTSLALHDGRLLVGGSFSSAGGAPRIGLAALNPTTGAALNWSPTLNAPVAALAVAGNAVVVAHGRARGGAVARLDATTGAVRWSVETRGRPGTLVPDGTKLLVGGSFDQIGGAARDSVASLRLRDGRVGSWRPRPLTGPDPFRDGGVRVIARTGDRTILGGTFHGVGGVARRHLAVLARRTLRPTARRLDERGLVSAMTRAFGRIYLVGELRRLRGRTWRSAIALDENTLRPVDWTAPAIGSPAYRVTAIGDKLVVMGSFNGLGTTDLRGSVLAVSPTSGRVLEWGRTDMVGNGVTAMHEQNGRIWALGGWTGMPNTVAALDPQTGLVRRRPLDNVDSGDIYALAPGAGNTAYVGGAVQRIGRSRVRGIARVDLASGRVLRWGASTGGTVSDIELVPGAVVAAGQIVRANGQVRTGLAAFARGTGHLLRWNPRLDRSSEIVRRIGDDLVVLGSFTGVGPRAQPYFAMFPLR